MNKLTHPGNLILAGLAGMILFMIYMVSQCLNQSIPLVNDNYYQKELNYQQEIDAKQNAMALGKKIKIEKEAGTLKVFLPAVLIENFKDGEINFYCPSDKSLDKKIAIQKQVNPMIIYVSSWKRVGYIGKIDIQAGDKKYFQEVEINL